MNKKNNLNVLYEDMSILKEDMLQIESWNILLDFWYYNWIYKIFIVKNYDWSNPLEIVEFTDENIIDENINLLKNKIMNWYYN